MPYLICVWRIVLFIICSYSAVTSIASASSLGLSSLLSDSRQPQSQQNRKLPTADWGEWTRRQHYITPAPPWFNSVFVLFPHNHNLLPPVEDNERADEQSFLLEPGFLSSERLFESWYPHFKILQKCVWRLERFYRCPCLGVSEVQSASH